MSATETGNTLRLRLHAIVDELLDHVESRSGEWVDQASSPLGRKRHCALVRAGKLPGAKDGRRVLVRRSDLDAYLAKGKVVRVDEAADEDAEVRRLMGVLQRAS